VVSDKKETSVIQGRLFTLLDDRGSNEYLYYDDGFLVVGDDGRILFVGPELPDEYAHNQIHRTQHLIFPGFVDAHVHTHSYRLSLPMEPPSLSGWISTRFRRRSNTVIDHMQGNALPDSWK